MKGSFKKGHTPWNKGKKGIHLSPDTEFKKGQNVGNKSHSWKGGIQYNKNDCIYINIGVNKRVRWPVRLYKIFYGEYSIPNGYVIWHKDGNKDNNAIFNLEAISRAEMLRRNRL